MALGSRRDYVGTITAPVGLREREARMAELHDDTAASRLEMVEDGQVVFANYRRAGDRLIIDHVEAPTALRGSGAAGRFMEALARHARAEGVKLAPICSYAAHWLARHPAEAAGIVD